MSDEKTIQTKHHEEEGRKTKTLTKWRVMKRWGRWCKKVVAQQCEHWEPWKGTSLPLTLFMMDNTCHDGVNPSWEK